MADYILIDSDAAAVELAGLLNGADRARPTVVVTIAAGQVSPYIDVDQIVSELGGLADVYLIATGPHTWTFSHHMREGTQVYGGAGRVYPVGHDWVQDLSKSPLRFAWGKAEGPRTTERLIDDGLDMAAAAGLLGSTAPSTRSIRRSGVVRRAENERAWVDFGRGGLDLGIVPPQLAEPDLPIERVLQVGMTVSGLLDPESRWFDIREERLPADEALAAYAIGDVVLADIADVRDESATARLLPSVSVRLDAADVTPDGADLKALLTPGEVVVARVLGRSPWWLTLLEVDDQPVPAASIYAGGPPWLLPPVESEPEADAEVTDQLSVAVPFPGAPPPSFTAQPAAEAPVGPSAPPRPSPTQMPGARRPAGDPPPPVHQGTGQAVRDLSLKVNGLQATTRALEAEVASLRNELTGVRYERDQLEALKNAADRRANRFEAELKKSRSALRKASSQQASTPSFADPERGFRYLVETAWARRIPVGEQPTRGLPTYALGPDFMRTLLDLEGITAEKVADVVMELVTGIAESSTGRDMHRLRTGFGGDDPIRQRADGAVCWRVALQINTPSARRLHAWKRSDGTWELSSVRKHDDMAP